MNINTSNARQNIILWGIESLFVDNSPLFFSYSYINCFLLILFAFPSFYFYSFLLFIVTSFLFFPPLYFFILFILSSSLFFPSLYFFLFFFLGVSPVDSVDKVCQGHDQRYRLCLDDLDSSSTQLNNFLQMLHVQFPRYRTYYPQ